MYSSTLEPLLKECRNATELALNGDIAGARQRLDRVRYLRALVARTRDVEGPVSDVVYTAASKNDALLDTYREMASLVNGSLEYLREWIRSSRASFSNEELRASNEGMQLLIDDLLPGVWDFTQDIAVLTDEDGEKIRELLRERGQRRFIWLSRRVGPPISGSLPDQQLTDEGDDLAANDTINLGLNETLEPEEFKSILGGSVPRMALLCCDQVREDQDRFNEISQVVSSAVIQATTAQWISVTTTEQYLANLLTIANCPSALNLRPYFHEANVLILSPGPSLRDVFDQLDDASERFVTIAPLKSLDSLFDIGVKPDFAIWQDPRDHSYIIPKRPELRDIPLILSESCHRSFFQAPFRCHFIAPDPTLVDLPTSQLLHGQSPPVLAGSSVSTLATVLSITLGASTVTLLGQDLSIQGGAYVSDDSSNPDGDQKFLGALTCDAIGGGEVLTQANYLAFIGEFRRIAEAFAADKGLYNCTSRGAYLAGWTHLSLAEHPIMKHRVKKPSQKQYFSLIGMQAGIIAAELRSAVDQLGAELKNAATVALELNSVCNRLIVAESTDVRELEALESKLRDILHNRCSVLAHYLANQSMAMKAAVESNLTLQDNLRLSSDYYEAISRASDKLQFITNSTMGDL